MKRLPVLALFITALIIANIAQNTVTQAQSYPAWAANVAYAVGNQVTYQDSTHPEHLYRCQQAHTSQAAWTPPATPALWVDEGAYGGATATNTTVPATKTNTPTVQPPTNTPVSPTATSSGSGGACAPAYVSTTAYTGGQV